MRRLIATSIVALLTAAAGLVAGAASPAAAAKPRPTPFALTAAGLGTLVKGGDAPASSGRTAFRVIGCTNRAPVSRGNHLAEVTLPEGMGVASGLTTRVWTTARNGVVSTNSRHSLTKLVLREEGMGKVVFKDISSQARAWHDTKGFNASRSSEVGSITYIPVEGGPEVVSAPTPGETIRIGDLAEISMGAHVRSKSRVGARANATAMKITVIPTGTTARIAYSRAKIRSGIKSGLFRGNSNATRIQAADGPLSSGPNPFLPMPCQGTEGEVQTNDNAGLDLGGQIVLGAGNTEQLSDQTRRKAWGYEKSSLSELNLGGGQLVIEDVFGKVNVVRKGGNLVRNVLGTKFGSITANGEPQTFPPSGPLEIPGVALIERRLVEKVKNGIKVTSVRVTLLDGTGTPTGTVIHLGEAQLRIMPSGR